MNNNYKNCLKKAIKITGVNNNWMYGLTQLEKILNAKNDRISDETGLFKLLPDIFNEYKLDGLNDIHKC